MKKAFKTYAQAPTEVVPPSIPLEWPWAIADIPDEAEASFAANGFIVLSLNEFDNYRQQRQEAFDTWANAYDQDRQGQELRVMSLVDEEFKNWHPSKIDFRRHLTPNTYLQKNVTYSPNGRPIKATYSYNTALIAEIEFIFETNAFNFMTRRTEKLAYYKQNNTLSEQWIIADDFYSEANPYHLREMMRERSESRKLIIEEVKASLNGILAFHYIPLGKTYGEILALVGEFWGTYASLIDAWINVGSPSLQAQLLIDVDTEILDVPVEEGVTVRDYIIAKTSY